MADTPAQTESRPGAVEIDRELSETDSVYGSDLSTYTTSLSSSLLRYRHENGRSYHAYRDGKYLLPNDDTEADRLDMMHEMALTILERRLHLAPLDPSIQRAIDLGTGTGIWAMDFADKFPSCQVIGNDLSPYQPTMVPPNLKFEVDDYEDEWTHPKDHFDFVHARFYGQSINDYPKLLEQCYRHTKPGGWVEFQDWDINVTSDDGSHQGTMLERYFEEVTATFEIAGRPRRPGLSIRDWFTAAGFVDVTVHRYHVPLGVWPRDRYYKKIGAWAVMCVEEGLEAVAIAVLTRFGKWSPLEVRVLVAKAKLELKSAALHSMLGFYVVYGRKPLPS